MELLVRIKKYKVSLIICGVLIAIIAGGKDSNFWGLVDKSGEQILKEIEEGVSISKEIMLTEKQEIEIFNIIQKNPKKYSTQQLSLISKKTGKEILNEIGSGKVNVKDVFLNFKQNNEIIDLITKNPNDYGEQQKYIIRVKGGEEILTEIGNGIRNPLFIKLTPNQFNEIRSLIKNNPGKYNDDQKSLIK